MPPLELTDAMARKADRWDRRRLAAKAFALKEAARLHAHRIAFKEVNHV